jgi:iron complex outermembrane receptor protein
VAAITCVVAAFGIGGAAEAAPARIQFRIEPKPYAEALLDVAQQANVTLIGAGACSGYFRGRLAGAMTLEQALGQVLDGAACNWRVVTPGGVEISPLPRAEARPQPPVTVSEVLVTATKRVRNQRELAVAVTAIPRDQLQATGSTDAGEASGQLGGVLATNLGPGRNKLLLRGLSDGAYTGRARSIVATYLDDLPINYNAPDPDLRLVDVERVEVARGPQGALYGAGSISGVYRIVARKPDLEHVSAELRGTASDTKDGEASRAIEGHVNLPLWRDAIGIRLSGYDEVQGGYLDDIGQQRHDVDQTVRRGARVSLYLQPTDGWSVNLTAAGQHLRSDDTHYTTPGLGLDRSVRIPEPHVNDIQLATGTVRASWGWGEFTSSSGYVRHAYGSLYDATATQLNYTSFAHTSAYSERTRTRMLVQDMFLNSRGAGRLEWLAGVYGSDTKLSSPTQFLVEVPGAPDALVYGDTRSDRIRELAAYGELTYQLAPSWTLAVGGRVFNIRERTVSDVVSERFAPRHVDRAVGVTGFSPKISLQHELAGGNLVYAVVSEGYRAGGVNSGGARPLPSQRETFAPDRLINFEVGLKLQALDKRLAVNSSVFYDIWQDIQTDQFRDSGIPYTTNAGDAHILGVETELSWRDPSGLIAQLNARLSRIRTTNVNADFTSDLVDGLPGAPSVSAGGLLGYERGISRDWTLRVVAQATYIGPSRVTFDRSRPQMGGYARTKLSAEIGGQVMGAPVALQVFVLNPLNDLSDTFAFGNPFNPEQIRQITPQRPRTIGVTLSAAI